MKKFKPRFHKVKSFELIVILYLLVVVLPCMVICWPQVCSTINRLIAKISADSKIFCSSAILYFSWWLFFIWIIPSKLIDLIKQIRGGPKKKHDLGAWIGVMERTIMYTLILAMYLANIEISQIINGIAWISLGLFGIKSIYRLHEKEHADWIIVGTLMSLTIGIISTLALISLLSALR